ncbi:TonB-dependent receptor plug domain-containing protein [Marisediminitalea sp.]|uniref:TonB-dependent receptor plug domain-containing protein n=1 Tax=Marisediminitalea sp. TaxID=2662268 RepID=UPI003516F2CE
MKAQSGQHSGMFKPTLLALFVGSTLSGQAFSQENQAENDNDVEKIEVRAQATGTLIRGATPVGTNVVGFDSAEVEAISVADSNELLAQIPQMSSTFNSRPTMATDIGQGMPMPKLRDIGVGGGSTTLLLLNGMRMPGSGIIQTIPNVSAIPPGVISNLEIVMDGGSSIYGSDAIAGVVNFITRDRFDGVEFSAEGGFGDSYSASTFNITAGKDWTTGSGMISIYHAQNDEVFGKDRDFITGDSTANGGGDYRSNLCNPGTITVDGVNYKMDSREAGTNTCDPTDGISYVPKEKKTTIYASLQQDLNDNAYVDVVTYYSEWSADITGDATNSLSDIGASGTITADNPYFSPIGSETSHSVAFDFSDVVGLGAKNGSDFDAFAFIPEITYELPNYWRLKAAYSYGLAHTKGVERGINSAALSAALAGTDTSTALNPYDVAATDQSVLNSILGYYGSYGDATQSHHQIRATLDGAIAELPAGEVLLAVGAEYFKQDYEVAFGGGAEGALDLVETEASRNVKSVFGEVMMPLMDSSAGEINFTASLRYDDYNDVGSTTNPKIGIDYNPTENTRIRAQWGTSFQAPSLADTGAAVDTRAIVLPVSPWLAGDAAGTDFFRGTILLAGGSDGLKPEESESYSVGFDWTPDFAEDLSVSMTYYNVDYSSAINLAPFYTPSVYFNTAGYAAYYTINPTLEEALAATEGFRIDGAPVESLYADGNSAYLLADARRYNMTATRLSGLDFDVQKSWMVDLGKISAGVSGTYTLKREAQAVEGDVYVDELETGTFGKFNVVASVGLSTEKTNSMVRILHSDGWENAFASLDSLTTVNVFTSYSLGEMGSFDNVDITMNIDNLFDEEAPYFDDANGFDGGNVIGRVFYIGVKAKM